MTMQNKRQLAAALAMTGMVLATQATTYYWKTDVGSGNWDDTTKWSIAGVPGASDQAAFSLAQSAPFTVSFTDDAVSNLTLGSSDTDKPVIVTFDLNGHTLTHTNSYLYANYALDWTILNGTLKSYADNGALRIGDYQTNYVPKVTIGSGATYLHNGTSPVWVGNQTAGEMVVQDGGKLITSNLINKDGALIVGRTQYATYTNYTARMTVTGSGSVWSNLLGYISLSTSAKATAELNVTDNGLLVNAGGVFTVGGGAGANAFLNISSGGVVDLRPASVYMSIGNSGTGTVTVTGSGSKLLVSDTQNFYLANLANASQGTLIIEKGGLFEKMVGNHNFNLGYRDNATGRVIVRDGGLLRWAGGSGTVYVGGAGEAGGAGSIGELTVTGTNSRAILGDFVIGQNRGHGLVTVADGGTLEVYRQMFVGRVKTDLGSHNGSAKLVVTGTDSVLKKSALTNVDLPGASIGTIISLGVGNGYADWNDSGLVPAAGYGPGGQGLVVLEHGGRLEINGTVAVFPNSELRIDGGRTYSGRIGLDTNAIFTVALRLDDANGTALMTASGEARIWGASLVVEKGADFVPMPGDVYTLITSDTLHPTINRFSYDGAIVQDGGLIKVEGTTFKVGYTANAVMLTVRNNGTMLLVR